MDAVLASLLSRGYGAAFVDARLAVWPAKRSSVPSNATYYQIMEMLRSQC